MAKKRPQVALVYDFDGTLSPGNMQEFGFIQATGKTKDEFWEKNRKFAVDVMVCKFENSRFSQKSF